MDEVEKAQEPSYLIFQNLFVRAVAIVYLIAFVSLGHQVPGLIGHNGILPAQDLLRIVREQTGMERYWLLPTLCWFNSSDGFLLFLCYGGAALSLLVVMGVAPSLLLSLLWVLYLSLASVCRDFLGFQWDILLLETGFLAVFLPQLSLFFKPSNPPTKWIVWMIRWLLFRLMFSSGIVKLLSGDSTWRNLTALQVHYQTQPLPTWIGWYMHQLPPWFQTMSCIVVFLAEIPIPFLVFAPRRFRMIGFVLLTGFQVLILLTGNYCFFNLLTIILCLSLLDDDMWPLWIRQRLLKTTQTNGRPWPRWILIPVTSLLLLLSIIQLGITAGIRSGWPPFVVQFVALTEPFETVNRYGLFAMMTTSRQEIIVEGSNDGVNWLPYEFKYKPGDLKRRPGFVAPYQPRLDWQMWFAALGTYQENQWFILFCERLLDGSPTVLDLLATNPFPKHPPQYIRAVTYQYRFTDLQTLSRDGTWWKRDGMQLYCPILSRR